MTLTTSSRSDWRIRRDTLANLQESLVRPLLIAETPRAETLRTMLACLDRFGSAQLDFFLDGFAASGFLEAHTNPLYTPDYALDVTLNQIGHDLDVLLRAIHHRSEIMLPQNLVTTGFQLTLNTADQLAMAALQPAIEKLPIKPATVLTYYQKSLSIRLLPYAPVALIGIPYSAAGVQRDMAAIFHEVGHYVVSRLVEPGAPQAAGLPVTRNKRSDVLAARLQLAAEPPVKLCAQWLQAWQDEVFADVYACMVGGPMTGFTMLDYVLRLPATRWLEDDGEHPLPILRPCIYAATMRAMAEGVATDLADELITAAAALDNATDEGLSGPLPAWLTFQPRRGAPLRLTLAREIIDQAVKDLVTGILKPLCPQGSQRGELWAQAPFALAAVYRKIDAMVIPEQPVELELLQSAEPAEPTEPTRVRLKGKIDSWPVGMTGIDMEWEKARQQDPDAISSLLQEGWNPWWLAVLSAGSWTTEGPGGGNPQPT